MAQGVAELRADPALNKGGCVWVQSARGPSERGKQRVAERSKEGRNDGRKDGRERS